MNSEIVDPRLEGVRAVLWAMSRLLDRNERLSLAARYELCTLTRTGLQLADEYFDSFQAASCDSEQNSCQSKSIPDSPLGGAKCSVQANRLAAFVAGKRR